MVATEPRLMRLVIGEQPLGDCEVGHRAGGDVAHDLRVGVHAMDERGIAVAERSEEQPRRLDQVHTHGST